MLDPSWDAHNWGKCHKNEEKRIGVGGLLLFCENLGPPQYIFTLIYYNIEQGVCHTVPLPFYIKKVF
jgi:hypothetical protein